MVISTILCLVDIFATLAAAYMYAKEERFEWEVLFEIDFILLMAKWVV